MSFQFWIGFFLAMVIAPVLTTLVYIAAPELLWAIEKRLKGKD